MGRQRKDRSFTDDLPNGEIYKIDPDTMNVVGTVEHARGGFPTVGQGAIWLINAEFGQTVTRVDLETRRRSHSGPAPPRIPPKLSPWRVAMSGSETTTTAPLPSSTRNPGGSENDPSGSAGWLGRAWTGGIRWDKRVVRYLPGRVRSFGLTRRLQRRSPHQLPILPHESALGEISQSESSPPETLIVIGDELWASTIDHIYVIDTTTIGEEQIVADIPTNGLWDYSQSAIDLEIFGRWCIPGRCIPGREPVEPTAIVKIDSRSRTATEHDRAGRCQRVQQPGCG